MHCSQRESLSSHSVTYEVDLYLLHKSYLKMSFEHVYYIYCHQCYVRMLRPGMLLKGEMLKFLDVKRLKGEPHVEEPFI